MSQGGERAVYFSVNSSFALQFVFVCALISKADASLICEVFLFGLGSGFWGKRCWLGRLTVKAGRGCCCCCCWWRRRGCWVLIFSPLSLSSQRPSSGFPSVFPKHCIDFGLCISEARAPWRWLWLCVDRKTLSHDRRCSQKHKAPSFCWQSLLFLVTALSLLSYFSPPLHEGFRFPFNVYFKELQCDTRI